MSLELDTPFSSYAPRLPRFLGSAVAQCSGAASLLVSSSDHKQNHDIDELMKEIAPEERIGKKERERERERRHSGARERRERRWSAWRLRTEQR